MAPPLIQLKDIRLTFGGTPLLTGAELSVSLGERVTLVGRNGSGKSTLLKIAAGLVEPDRGSRFVQPGVTVRYLPQEPDFAGHSTTLAYVEAGLGDAAATDHYRAAYLLEQLGLTGREVYDVVGIEEMNSGPVPREVTVRADGREFRAVVRIDTPGEAEYYRHGGIMQYVLRSLRAS